MMNAIRIPLIALMFMVLSAGFRLDAQTAPDFTATDCSNVTHSLHSMLDSGYVVVIVWVMPCFSCLNPALTAYSIVQNTLLSHPGKVRYLLVDDYGDTPCGTLSGWGSNNGITAPWAVFSDTAIRMTAFGNPGMPKVVIVCGTSHSVVFNQNNSIDATAFGKAMEDAIECSSQTGIGDQQRTARVSLFPNPSIEGRVTLSYALSTASHVHISVISQLGETVMEVTQGWQGAGEHSCELQTGTLPEGIYHVILDAGGEQSGSTLIISR